jgi:hypothetical protein
MARHVNMEECLRSLAAYKTTPPQRVAALAFCRAEAEAFLSYRKSKCFLLIPADEAALKAGEGRVVFREPTQAHHVVFEPDGSKTKGLARPGSFSVGAKGERQREQEGAGGSVPD